MAEPDRQTASLIDADLENARRLFQPDRHLIDSAICPHLCALPDCGECLLPLVERFVWHRERGDSNAPELYLLARMIHVALHKTSEISEPQFLAVADIAQSLRRRVTNLFLQHLARAVAAFEVKGQLSPRVTAAAYDLTLLAQMHRDTNEQKLFTWPLVRSGTGLAQLDSGWSKRVIQDLDTMKPKVRAKWVRALVKGRGARITTPPAAHTDIVVKRWIEFLGEEETVRLSPVGAVMFFQVIFLCQVAGEPLCDELNYTVARAPWKEILVPYWVHEFVTRLGSRPRDRAFACLEALMMNPATADRDVQRQYNALITVMTVRERTPVAIGIDGFPLDRDAELTHHQQRIDQLLRMAATGVEQYRDSPQRTGSPSCLIVSPDAQAALVTMVEEIVTEFAGAAGDLHRAATIRSDWIRDHHANFKRDTLQIWRHVMFDLDCGGGLVQRCLAHVESLPLESLLDGLRLGGGPKALELAQKHVASNGWTPALVETIHRWIPSIGSALSDQIYRARAEWFVWWEDVCPIELDACWSHRVKRDLRAMPAEERAAWRTLLDHNSFQYTGKPPGNWRRGADAAFAKVGLDRFRERFLAWFAPFDQGEPQRITITGRNIARVLMWFALAAMDPAVDEGLTGFANARWKTKDSAARAALAEMAFAFVLSERAPESAIPILEKQVSSGHAFDGSKTHLVYRDLCLRWNRTPVPAIPKQSAPIGKKEQPVEQPRPAITVR